MTTLKTFQTEIDEIHNREVAKQRAKATIFPEKEAKDQRTTSATAKGKAKDDAPTLAPTKPIESATVIQASSREFEDRILVWEPVS